MPLSPLKQYTNIAKLLMQSTPLSLDQMTKLLKVESPLLKRQVGFLVNQGIIKEKDDNLKITYTIATKGIRILKFFKIPQSEKIHN